MEHPTTTPPDGPRTPGEQTADRPGRARVGQRLVGAVRGWRPRRPRRGWWPVVGLVALAAVASVVFGVTTASVQSALGPHVTRYDVTTDSTVTIDFGPLGTLQIDSPLPLTLGVRATVQEIPSSVTELGEARTLQALSNDLSAYVQFFSGPATAVRDIAVALVSDALLRSALAFVVLVAAWWVLRAVVGLARRDEIAAWFGAHARPVTAGTLALVLGATVLTSSVGPGDRPGVGHLSSAVFDGTPLEGARVTGRLGGVIDTYGAYAVDAWRQNESFYRDADDALVAAWQQWQDDEAARPADAAVDGPPGAQDDGAAGDGAGASGDGGDASQGEAAADPSGGGQDDPQTDPQTDPPTEPDADAPAGTPGPRRSPTPSASPTPEVDPVVLVVVSDLHCNVGMATLIGSLADLAGADAVLDAGDTTMNGTSVEQYCVSSFARAVPSGVQLVTSPGNHDSRETSAMYARAGATVLDGGVVDVAGVRILGDHDPKETRVGAGGTAAASAETPAEMGARLAEVACEAGDVDLLLIHTPTVGDAALDEGCVPAQVSGHYHRRVDPEQVGLGIRYISSSTAGATLNQPTVGPLRGIAQMTVLRFDPQARRVLDYQVVEVTPQATVTVNPRSPWPRVVGNQDEARLPWGGPPADDPAADAPAADDPAAAPDAPAGTDASDG
jgi:predicted phosphodiesterase